MLQPRLANAPVKSAVFGLFSRIIEVALKTTGLDIFGVWKMKIPAAWPGTGNPTLQLPGESAAAVGSKTHRVIQQYGHRFAAPAASDPVSVVVDRGGNRWIGGKFVDLSSHVTDADYMMGLRPVTPGNTLITNAQADTERSEAGTSQVEKKRFTVYRPGKYRIVFDLSRDAGVAEAEVYVKVGNNASGTEILVSAGLVTEDTATYPTFAAKTVDMSQPLPFGGGIIIIKLRQQSSGTATIANAKVKYADATDTLAIYDAVIKD